LVGEEAFYSICLYNVTKYAQGSIAYRISDRFDTFSIMNQLAMHWKILIGMLLGAVVGLLSSNISGGAHFINDWIEPIGQIFIRLLKVIAVPLVIVSMIKGISELKNLAALSKIGGRTVMWFAITTVFAVILGLVLVNIFTPGGQVSASTVSELTADYTSNVDSKLATIEQRGDRGPLAFFIEMVPQNIFQAVTDNGRMLQVIFFTVFFSICLLMLPQDRQRPVIELIDITNDVLLKMIHVIMMVAPYAVFALIATLVVETTNGELFIALLNYALALLGGMLIILLSYVVLIKTCSKLSIKKYVNGIFPAQLVALSTSSSMATLPMTMDSVERDLGVDKQISSFVCPVGATINMDATSLMQGLAAIFICQVMDHDLTLADQLIVILTASLASVGAAGAPSAGIVMLVIVLESVGFPSEKLPIALGMILAVDRPLDMCRTVVNITGDACVAVLVAESVNKED